MCSTATNSNDLGLTDKNHGCACSTENHLGHGDHSAASTSTGSDVIREHFVVRGMTCNHCVSSVTEEISAIDGVQSVSVDLNAGGQSNIMVVSTKPIAVDDVRCAVTEAGYELVTA
jgi:copper chaperone